MLLRFSSGSKNKYSLLTGKPFVELFRLNNCLSEWVHWEASDVTSVQKSATPKTRDGL